MGVFDKIKNALFEEEYVEVDEKPKAKIKKDVKKPKKETREIKVHDNKPIAKKIVLPSKKEELEEELDSYKPRDEDFEIVPEREEKEDTSEFRFPAVEDEEFERPTYHEEPKIVGVVREEEIQVVEKENLYQGHSQTAEDYPQRSVSSMGEAYHGRDGNLYHSDYNDSVSIHEYGTYEKEKKPIFKPSPIISPIYGILDKNYKKEEIVPKREVRLSSYTREHMSVDDVRRKAYGNLADEIALDIDGKVEETVEEEVEDTDNLLVDLSNDAEKPKVSSVTVGDAEEYFRDLGLEYNIDYKDSSKEKATGRRVDKDYNEDVDNDDTAMNEEVDNKEKTVTESPADDNLFDLIDSMYEEEKE